MLVSSTAEVLETFRQDVVRLLQAGFKLPADALETGNAMEALTAWLRVRHRGVAARPRRVRFSQALRTRALDPVEQEAVTQIADELRAGRNMTPRMTREFFRSGFNDFLFNNFGIHHFHLGGHGEAWDKTRQHRMAGGGPRLLFCLISGQDALLLDVLDHEAFHDVAVSRGLAETALREGREFLGAYICDGVLGCDQTFESAFAMARAGACTIYELDGVFLRTGGTVLDGRPGPAGRAPCTSVAVVMEACRILNAIARLTEAIASHADEIAEFIARSKGARPEQLAPVVALIDEGVTLVDQSTESYFSNDRGTMCFMVRTGEHSFASRPLGFPDRPA